MEIKVESKINKSRNDTTWTNKYRVREGFCSISLDDRVDLVSSIKMWETRKLGEGLEEVLNLMGTYWAWSTSGTFREICQLVAGIQQFGAGGGGLILLRESWDPTYYSGLQFLSPSKIPGKPLILKTAGTWYTSFLAYYHVMGKTNSFQISNSN